MKFLTLLHRALLIVGVLVALTPCGLCEKAQAAHTCSMKAMSGKMDCCRHSNPVSPLCKVMDQSSTVSVAKHVAPVPAVVVQPVAVPVLAFAGTVQSFSAVLDTSPFRAPLSLRI